MWRLARKCVQSSSSGGSLPPSYQTILTGPRFSVAGNAADGEAGTSELPDDVAAVAVAVGVHLIGVGRIRAVVAAGRAERRQRRQLLPGLRHVAGGDENAGAKAAGKWKIQPGKKRKK